MDEPWRHVAEWNNPATKRLRVIKFIKIENWMVVTYQGATVKGGGVGG